ncbi:MAG: ATP-binding protein [Sphaerochaeta sp.]
MYIPRDIQTQIEQALQFFPVISLTGARQSGKTTALRTILSSYNYVSLELPSLAEQAERDPVSFLSTNPAPLIIDEIQYAPVLFRHLKLVVDENRHTFGQYVLVGSQHLPFMQNISESLAGRVAILELENLSLAEISYVASHTDRLDVLKRVIVRGQFPELWRNEDFPISLFYSSYLATYLERDVRQILNVTSLRDFERFIRILATRSASLLNKSEVARDVGVSVKAITDWLSVLQTSGQVVLLEPWFENFGKRIAKSPKIFFCDTGLLCYLLGIDEQNLETSPFLGMIWETFLFSELRKTDAYRSAAVRIWHYRDQYGSEIDFIIEGKGTLSFLEAKWTEHPRQSDARVMAQIVEKLKSSNTRWKAGNRYVIARPHNRYPLEDGTQVIRVSDIQNLEEISQ